MLKLKCMESSATICNRGKKNVQSYFICDQNENISFHDIHDEVTSLRKNSFVSKNFYNVLNDVDVNDTTLNVTNVTNAIE